MIDMIINMAKTTTAVASVVFAFLYGGWTVSLIALVVFVVLEKRYLSLPWLPQHM
ncbi:hypothetical protein [Roseburia sp. 1XD42-34]|uniref:hypothetical protein n=1 Tax=Roseburia sp. 1XD42-34 TaxID=2305905 RepID=UPI0025706A4F|nr:hypothetical protein [Roseburia sp. 1XD42-34]